MLMSCEGAGFWTSQIISQACVLPLAQISDFSQTFFMHITHDVMNSQPPTMPALRTADCGVLIYYCRGNESENSLTTSCLFPLDWYLLASQETQSRRWCNFSYWICLRHNANTVWHICSPDCRLHPLQKHFDKAQQEPKITQGGFVFI